MNRRMLLTMLAGAALSAALVASPAAARYGPPDGGGGKPGGGEETAGNNLSVPAIFVGAGGPALRLPCGAAVAPGWDGTPTSTDYPGYWLQKTAATWGAECSTATTANVTADWGDNLTKGATLTSGKPIRVEVGLLDLTATGKTGYLITNLTPDLEDRLATYGTRGDPTDKYLSGSDPTVASAPPTRVFDAGATLKIEKLNALGGTPTSVVFDGVMTAEINSGGAVVYGYNWGTKGRANAAAPGIYRLTFTANNTEIIGITDGTQLNAPTFDSAADTTTIEITLTSTKPGGGKPAQ